MASIEIPRADAATGVLGHTVAQIMTAVHAWYDARATRVALSKLSDRELDDIGLSREDVARIGIHH